MLKPRPFWIRMHEGNVETFERRLECAKLHADELMPGVVEELEAKLTEAKAKLEDAKATWL
jgi:hypothetical protein